MFRGTDALRRALQLTALALTLFVTSRALAEQIVTVLYAGSLVGLMERSIGPAFKQQTGNELQGHAGGSKALAMQIKEGSLVGDVFISADPQSECVTFRPHERRPDQVVHYFRRIAPCSRRERFEPLCR